MFLPGDEIRMRAINKKIKRFGRDFLGLFVWALLFCSTGGSKAEAERGAKLADWNEIKGKHFLVYYLEGKDYSPAREILLRAEDYYQKIGSRIGFTRYSDFWTWEQRAKIFVFPDQAFYMRATGQPEWSTGYADNDFRALQSRAIVTYYQEDEFIDGLLPHEIGHLILHDFITEEVSIPIWFDEGIAQLFEKNKSRAADGIMRQLLDRDAYIDFDILMRWDIRKEADQEKALVFYAQSLSVVEFMIKRYGADNFAQLCRNLRDRKNFNAALQNAYSSQLADLKDLEAKWLKFMKQ
jgi:hypothetical protein